MVSDDDGGLSRRKLELEVAKLERELEKMNLKAVVELILKIKPSLETVIYEISGHSTLGSVCYQTGPNIEYDVDGKSHTERHSLPRCLLLIKRAQS